MTLPHFPGGPPVPFAPVVVSLPIADRRVSLEFYRAALGLDGRTEAGVDVLVERARGAGAEVVTQPGRHPLGYAGAFADPDGHVWMVTAEPRPG